MFQATLNNCNVAIAMPPQEKKQMIDALSDINILYDALSNTKIQNAQASEAIDRQRILNIVKLDVGFESFNNHVNDLIRNWIKDRVLEVVHSQEEGQSERNGDVVDSREDEEQSHLIDFAALCSRVGVVLDNNGETTEALNLQQKALDIRQSELGEDHPLVGISHNHVATVLERKGDYESSLSELESAIVILEKHKNEYSQDLAQSYYTKGYILSKQGKDDEALDFYQKSLDQHIDGSTSEETQQTARCYNDIGTSLRAKKRYDEALKMYQKALDIRIKLLGKSHPEVAISYNHIGRILGMKNEHSKALDALNKALKIRQRILGEDHRETATSYHNVGVVLGDMKHFDEALKMLRKGLQVRLDTLGLRRRATADSYEGIGMVLWNKGGCKSEALENMQKAHTIRIEVLGEDHPLTIESCRLIDEFEACL